MKKIYALLSTLLFTASIWSQSPEKMSYQAVIRDNNSQLITNHAVGMRISILQGSAIGMVVYSETQSASTNANGLLSLEIGVEAGFDTIHWENGPYFIKTETDPAGGTNYTITGTSQLLSVPYALYAKTAGNITGNITETDPLFVSSPAHGILSSQILNWDSAYSWGNHATVGYLTSYTETDPIFFTSPAYSISSIQITKWDSTYSWGNHALAGYLTSFTETDPLFNASVANGILSSDITNWNTAYGWGNHALAGYLTSYTETDPIWSTASTNYYTKTNMQTNGQSQLHFDNITSRPTTLAGYGITDAMNTSHAANGILSSDITNWNTAFGWGNHALAGYLTSFTETDPIWSTASTNYYTKTNMQTSGQSQLHFNNITNKPTTLAGYGITDAMNTAHVANGITSTNITNWNTAFGWGNHALAGYLTSYTETDPIWSTASTNYYTKTNMQTSGQSQLHFNNITNKPTTLAGYGITDAMNTSHAANGITSTNITNWNTAYGWGDHALAGYLTSYTETDPQVGTNTTGFSPIWNGTALITGLIFQGSGKIGIGTTTPSAVLDISSQTGGILIPRMTTAERDLISNPALGLQIYNTTTNCFNVWSGSTWGQICPDCGFTPVAGNNGPICAGLTLNLSAETIPGATYSWTGPNGFTSTLQNPTIPNATTDASGAYYVAATVSGCTSTPTSTVATVTPSLGPTTVTYNNPVCVNNTLTLSATATAGASYTWSGPNNYFSNIQNPTIPNVQASHAGTYHAAATVGNCTSSGSVTVTVNPIPAQPGVITGTFSLLPPQTGIAYSVVAVSGATSYTWAYSGTGATISGQGTNTITINFACGSTSGNLSVTANNICGGSSPAQSQAILISTLGQPSAITGTTPVVLPQTGFTYSVGAVTGATSYTWTVPASLGTIASGQGTNSITVNYACGATAGLISVVANNACGSSLARTLPINIASLPTPGTISGSGTITYPQTGVPYSVPAVSGASTYTWTVPTGATIASGQGSNSITVDYACGAASGNLSVIASNTCGSSGANSMSVSISTSTPATPGAISGTNNLPAGVSGAGYSIVAISGATSYTWDVPTGATIVSGQGTTAITVNYSCSAISGNISVTANNGCGTSSARTYAITVNGTPAQPGGITGISSVPQGGTGITYSIATVTGATSYAWSFTGTGATIISGQGTNSITVDFACGATNGNIVVNASNGCATPSPDRTLGITIISTLATPGAITGTGTPLKGQTSTPYSVASVNGATIYTWSAPSGATITSGQGTNSILVDFGCSAVNGNVSVAVSNACIGAGTPSNKAITLNSTMTAPGTITGITSVPQGKTGVTYSITAVPGATTYYWTYTGTGATVASGQGSTSVTVDYACTATNGNISVTASNACIGPSTASTLAITVNALSTPGTITGLASVPQGSTGIYYSIPAVAGATSYTWIVPLGATIAHGQGTTAIWVDYGCTVGSGNILVTANNTCGSSGGSSLNITITTSIPATPGGITTVPTTSIPKGLTNVIHSIATVTGAASYTWTVPAGATITSGQGTNIIIVDYSCGAVSGNVSVMANNTCGSSTASTTWMDLMTSPWQPGGITGTASVPKGSSGFTYSVASIFGATLYTWTVPAGAYITSGQGTTNITVDYSCSAVNGNITVNSSNACGNVSTNSVLGITVTSSLASLGVITGTTSPLFGQNSTPYSVAPITGATTYTWSVPGGATVSSGQGTSNIGVDFPCGASNGTIIVSASNGCANTAPVSLSFALSSTALTQPAAITGLTSIPRGSTGVAYSITAVTGATTYTWAVPANCVITSGQGTVSITVDYSSCSAESGNISVTAENACVAASPARILAVTVTTTALPTPGAITGLQTPVPGQTNVTYTIAAVTGASSYTWSYSGTGASIISGQGSTSITVNYACGSTNGNISVTASNGCVATSASQNLAITLGNTLATLGAISGSQAPIFGQTGITYSISPISGASSYTWTVSSGATITSGQGTSSISVDFSCTAQANGVISVVANNGCIGQSSSSALSYAMGGTMATPGTIAGLTTVSKGTTAVPYSVSPLNGATSYIWSVPSGYTITSGQGTNSIKVDYGCTAANGNITVIASNSCTTSSASSLTITVSSTLPTPGTIAGTTTPAIGSTVNYTIVPIYGASNYNWSTPSGVSIISGAGTNSVNLNFTCGASNGNISVTANNSCIAAGTASTLAITPMAATSIGTLGNITETINSGTNNRTYSVVSVGNATYNWTVPSGMTIVSGQGTSSINVTNSGTVNGTISVTASNTCLSQNNTSNLNINFTGCNLLAAVSSGQYGYIQTWIVPAGVTSIAIEVFGAQGGNSSGKGAKMKGEFSVTSGQTLKILVGQKGSDGNRGGGGGGTFVTDNNNTALIVAGGGSANPAPTTNNGTTNGGTSGCAGGGGGLIGNGIDIYSGGGKSFINGGFGGNAGSYGAPGGYGGGGGGECWNCCNYGGGGGYSGGGSNEGGGSYNAGTNQSNTAGVNAGDGKVIITW